MPRQTCPCVHAWVCACKDVFFVTPLAHSDHTWQEGSKILKSPKVLGKQATKLRRQTPPGPLVRERPQRHPVFTPAKANMRQLPDYPVETKPEETRLCRLHGLWHHLLLLSLQSHWAFIALGTWTVLIRRRWVCSPLLPHLRLQYRLETHLPRLATELASSRLSTLRVCFNFSHLQDNILYKFNSIL